MHLRTTAQDNTTAIICEDTSLTAYYRSIAIYAVNRSIDEIAITGRGKRNLFVYTQIKEMKDRFQQKQRLQLFDENTLAPMHLVIDNMISVKLEDDM